ncbi:MAG: hypothetical protein ACERIH_07440 [Labilibaculum antarcticum]
MIDWIEQYIGLKVFLIMLGIILLFVGFSFGSKFNEQDKFDDKKGDSEAIVSNMTLKKVQVKLTYETTEKVEGYNITYYYQLKDKTYSNTEVFEANSDARHLFNNFTKGDSCFLEIRYALKTPSESIIFRPIFK